MKYKLNKKFLPGWYDNMKYCHDFQSGSTSNRSCLKRETTEPSLFLNRSSALELSIKESNRELVTNYFSIGKLCNAKLEEKHGEIPLFINVMPYDDNASGDPEIKGNANPAVTIKAVVDSYNKKVEKETKMDFGLNKEKDSEVNLEIMVGPMEHGLLMEDPRQSKNGFGNNEIVEETLAFKEKAIISPTNSESLVAKEMKNTGKVTFVASV